MTAPKIQPRRCGARRAVALAATAASCVALAACDSGTAEGGSTSAIRFASFVPLIGGFDPSLAQANQLTYLGVVYDTLLREDDQGAIKPGLASSYSYESPTSLVLHLRSGVKFSDGEAFDAAAAVANLQRNEKSGGNLSSHLAAIKTATAVNPTTVRLKLSKPATSLLSALADIPGMMAGPKAFASLKTKPVGTGPWTYDAGKSSSGAVYYFTKNAKYWDAATKPASDLKIQVVQNYKTQLNGVQSGQYDVTAIQADQAKQAKAAGLKVTSALNARLSILILDRKGMKVPALGKTAVRQAMNLAIDRSAMFKALSPGYGEVGAGFWVPNYWAADPSTKTQYPHDVAKARQLLAGAGYANGFSVDVGTIPVFQPWAEAMQAQLKQVKINLKIHLLQNGVLAKTIRANTYPLILTTGGGTASGDPGSDVQQALLPMSPNNPEHFTVPQIVSLAKQGETLTEQSQRQPIYRQIDRIATTQAVNVTVGYEAALVTARRGIKGVEVLGCGGAACVRFTGVTLP